MTTTLPPTHPNAGVTAAYRKRLDALIAEMQASLVYWLSAKYRANEPEMAADASPAMEMRKALRRLRRRWERNFAAAAPPLAETFTDKAMGTADRTMQASLRKAGISVRFKMSKAQNDAYQAVLAENVSLIKSIADQHLTAVEGHVMRSVAAGRDLGPLAKTLEEQFGVTKRRAALIARDQNNKCTAVITRVRQKELGITKAKWLHSAGGKEPRPSHVAFSGQFYDIDKGAFLDGEWVHPGEAINCRCVSVSVIPGLS